MKLLETLVLSQSDDAFAALTANLPIDTATVMGVETHRLAMDSDLAALMYHASLDAPPSEAMLEHLFHHLSAVLVLVNATLGDLPETHRTLIDTTAARNDGGSLVVAVQSDPARIDALPEVIRTRGMALGERGRMVFWNPHHLPSRRTVLTLLWHDLLEPATV